MQRSTSIYGSSSALRGVQLKIGEKYKPPAKVTLPVGWKMRDPSRLLSLTYDFSLEEGVLSRIRAEREAKERIEQAQKIKELQQPTANPVVAHMGADILQPTTATTTTTTTNSLDSNNDNKQFNYKDFENNTDTPFEDVELQSINNMEALKSVLQPDVAANSVSSSQQQVPQGIPIRGNPFNQTTSSNSLETTFPISGSPGQTTGASSYPPAYPNNPVSTQSGLPNSNPFAAPNLLGDPAPQGVISNGIGAVSTHEQKVSHPGAIRVLPTTPARPPPRRPASVPNENVTSEMMSAFPSHNALPSATPAQRRPVPKPRTKLPPLKNGPEVRKSENLHSPPTSPEVEPHYDVLHYDVPPPIPPKKAAQKSREIERGQNFSAEDAHLGRFPTPLPPISPPEPTSSPIDPRATMSHDEVQLVNQISDMGFPLERVARAVRNLNGKEREVVDFLISVNELCNQGYDENDVEMVLKDNIGQTKAVEILKLQQQFRVLGFEGDKVFEAIKKSECNRDKALDILISAG
ncbi:ubiquitin-associated protein 1-like [Dendronephthya gigantea]|uniref:ubiquitin-associated protein 1-like n=1 Tax=Dendronephthya gigantea TaxID=151771 RepID=UPI00106BD210|nr:ubiquitin-associated protein 1-like [Dendronephthya gigantea]